MRMKNYFHINADALSLALKQRLGTTRKWLIEIVTLLSIGYDEVALETGSKFVPQNSPTIHLDTTPTSNPSPPTPKSRMKQCKSQNAPFSHPWFKGRGWEGDGGTNFPSFLSKIIASCFLVQPQNCQFRKSENLLMISLQNAFGNAQPAQASNL